MALSDKVFVSGSAEAGISNTKLRQEQMKSELGFTTLAGDVFALSKQIEDIIGDANWKADVSGLPVQMIDLNAHISADKLATEMEIKQDLLVSGDQHLAGAAQFDTTLAVDGQATLASANVADLTSGQIVVAGTNGELEGFEGLTYVGGELTVASATVSDLTEARVVFAGVDGSLVDSDKMTFVDGVLTVSGSTFSKDVTIAGNLIVQGETVTVNVGEMLVEDKDIVVAKNGTNALGLDGAGIKVGDGGTYASLTWSETDSKWSASEQIYAPVLQSDVASALFLKSDVDGDIVAGSAADFGALMADQLIAGTGVSIDENTPAAGQITISIGQAVGTSDSVEFAGITDSALNSTLVAATAGELRDATAGDIGALLVEGTGVHIDAATAQISIGQEVETTSTPEFAALNLGAYGDLLAVGSNFKIAASAELLFGDSYQAGSSFSTALKLAESSAEWSAIEAAYGSEKTLLGMLAAAAPAANKRLVKVQTMATSGNDAFVGAGDAGGAFPTGAASYQNGKSDVYVNGQKQVEGNTKDFEFMDVPGGPEKVKINFKYALQVGDVVELVRYPSAAK